MRLFVIATITQPMTWRRMLLNMADPPSWNRSSLNPRQGIAVVRPTILKAVDAWVMFARW
ncbi:hypothetical protein JYT77_00045 [bacterium AH-315-K15]|jgi:hypothetical protein|nr:hypothetical protein [bacterium AH-315-K15]